MKELKEQTIIDWVNEDYISSKITEEDEGHCITLTKPIINDTRHKIIVLANVEVSVPSGNTYVTVKVVAADKVIGKMLNKKINRAVEDFIDDLYGHSDMDPASKLSIKVLYRVINRVISDEIYTPEEKLINEVFNSNLN